jgi:Tfp pilus assembly protein PilE
MLNKWRQRLTANHGYTIDQTILIVAIIAILITLIIITIGWQLIGRSNGTKLGAQMRQIEDANGTFYSDQKMWPSAAVKTGASATNNIMVLMNQVATGNLQSTVDTTKLTNQLPGLKVIGGAPVHSIGGGGAANLVTEQVNTPSAWGLGSGQFMVVQFANVPLTEAGEADEAIDGASGSDTGRLVYSSSACLNTSTTPGNPPAISATPTSGAVYVCYAANAIQ